MRFRFYPTAQKLQPFIEGYLEADSRTSLKVESHVLFPNGFSGVFFNFGYLGKLLIKEEHETPKVSVFGQIDQRFEAVHAPGSYSLGVLLKPSVLARLLRVNMTELTNRTFDGALIRKDLVFLHEALLNAQHLTQRVELLDQFFLSTLPGIKETPLVDHAIARLQRGTINIRQLARQLKVSDRYLETQFRQYVGLSPKTYSMILRFKRMEQQLNNLETTRWAQLDLAHEYYDQNHFIKEFKRFTGNTPSEYLLENFEMGRSYLIRG